ncbi:hypothetical protein PPTG_20454, partial [Phytophthora nicotianae INRA-310]
RPTSTLRLAYAILLDRTKSVSGSCWPSSIEASTKTTRQLVKQPPKPRKLEEAVDKATEIDDPIDNVVQGMHNIGQAWSTAPNTYLVLMDGTTGQVLVIPDVGSGVGAMEEGNGMVRTDGEDLAYFTNPQGVWNKYTGLGST